MPQPFKTSFGGYRIGEVIHTSRGPREILGAPMEEAPGIFCYMARVYDPNRSVYDEPAPTPRPSRLRRAWAFLNRPLF